MSIPADYTPAPDLLKERVILITGAGDGIGRAAAKAFAAHGATVVLLGRTTAKLEQVYDEIEQAGHPQPALYPLNLEGAVPKDYEELAAILSEAFGRLDGILHNAALLGSQSPMVQYDVETWFKVMQVNLNAPYMLTQACLPLLFKSEDASVLFTSDKVGRKGRAYWGAYGVSKAGVENLMQMLADELDKSPVRVNSIDPGAIHTRMRVRAYPGELAESNPKPESVMASYLYLMGPDSKGVTGQAFSAQAEDALD